MEALYYQINEDNNYKLYCGLWHIILCRNGKYFMNSANTIHTKDWLPLNISGTIKSINSYSLNHITIISTDVSTYLLDTHSYDLNIVCTQVELTYKTCILRTIDNKTKMLMYYDNTKISNSIVIANHSRIDVFKYSNSHSQIFTIYKPMPDDFYYINSGRIIIIRIGNLFYIFKPDTMSSINKIDTDFKIKKIFADNSVKTSFTNQNIYILDLQGWIWTFDLMHKEFCKLFKLENDISSRIKEIFKYENQIYAIGNNFIIQYDLDSCKTNTYFVNLTNDISDIPNVELELISSIFENYIIIRVNLSEIILIGRTTTSIDRISNTNINVNYITGHLENVYICHIQTKDYIPLMYSFGHFFITIGNNNYDDRNNFLDIFKCDEVIVDFEINLQIHDISINHKFNKSDIFNIIYYWLISKNFTNKLLPYFTHFDGYIASGPGARRVIYSELFDYVKNNLLEIDYNSVFKNAYKLNIKNNFWSNPNNCYYFGKLLLYLTIFRMDYSLSLSSLLIIYKYFLKINNKNFDINQLAIFHKMYNPSEYQSILNLDLEYKINENKFKQLSMPYDTFENMIYSLMSISEPDKIEKDCLELIAYGMCEFNRNVINLSLYELYKKLCEPFIYDRKKVIESIQCVSNYTNESSEMNLSKIRNFLENLTDDELKTFMINVTGHTIRDRKVHLYIDYCSDIDISISTCSDRITISNRVFDEDNYLEILKSYLCQKDMYIKD
jgi:hypothetical protein